MLGPNIASLFQLDIKEMPILFQLKHLLDVLNHIIVTGASKSVLFAQEDFCVLLEEN